MPIVSLPAEWDLNVAKTSMGALPNGVAGNLETVEIMRRVARARSVEPKVRELALSIVRHAGIPSQNYLDEAIAIAKFVQAKVRYVRDIRGVETLHDPLTMIDQIQQGRAQGDCDDMSLLIATLLLSIGHSPRFAIVKYQADNPTYNHIYVVVYEKNKTPYRACRASLDAIVKNKPIGFEVPSAFKKEIVV